MPCIFEQILDILPPKLIQTTAFACKTSGVIPELLLLVAGVGGRNGVLLLCSRCQQIKLKTRCSSAKRPKYQTTQPLEISFLSMMLSSFFLASFFLFRVFLRFWKSSGTKCVEWAYQHPRNSDRFLSLCIWHSCCDNNKQPAVVEDQLTSLYRPVCHWRASSYPVCIVGG